MSTGADALLHVLAEHGINKVFLVPGAHLEPLLQPLGNSTRVSPIVCTHELGSGYMADGFSRVSGQIAACASIGGPGAANLVPAAATARAHDSPVLFLSGSPPLAVMGRGGFQASESDIPLFEIAAGASRRVESSKTLPKTLNWALRRLYSRPPAPVHLSVPYDILESPCAIDSTTYKSDYENSERAAIALLPLLESLANSVNRVAILAGPRSRFHLTDDELTAFAESCQLPIATTGDAKGIIAHHHPLHLGNFGYGGNPRAAAALCDPDLEMLLVIGAELNERNSGGWDPRLIRPSLDVVDAFSAGATLGTKGAGPIRHQPAQDPTGRRLNREMWVEELQNIPREAPMPADVDTCTGVHPALLVKRMSERLPNKTRLFVDAGAHRLFALHYWQPAHRLGLITAGITAPTGWGICAAIGGALADASELTVVLTGDACMLMHGTELATAARYHARVVFVVSNNSANGNVLRRLRHSAPHSADLGRLPTVDWVAFARSLGVAGVTVSKKEELASALDVAQRFAGPFLIDVHTPADCNLPIPEHVFTSCHPDVVRRFAK